MSCISSSVPLMLFLLFCFIAGDAKLVLAQGLKANPSPLTDRNYSVRMMSSGGSLMSCAAVNRKTKPPIFLNQNFLGSGAITIIAEYFSIALAGAKEQDLPVSIAGRDSVAQALVDGHLLTIALSKTDLKNAQRRGMSINGVSLDIKNLRKLYALTSRCLRK